jgi:hypothetical protein
VAVTTAQWVPEGNTPAQRSTRGAGSGRLDTPTRLWLLLATAVAAVLTVGLVTGFSLAGRESTASRTAQSTEALYAEVQNLSYSLADANATAATALLSGPETSSEVSSRYNADITEAEDLLAAASQRVAGNVYASGELKLVAEQIPEYTGLIGQALAENRLGYPVAGAYLRQASLLLTGSLLAETGDVVKQQQGSTTGGIGSASSFPLWIIVFGLLGFLALRIVARRLTRITRRRINLGLLGATIAVIGLLGWSLFAFGGAGITASSANTDFSGISQAQTEISEISLAETYTALQQIDRGEDQGADATAAKQALTAASPVSGEAASSGADTLAAAEKSYGAFDACMAKAISLGSDGEYQSAVDATVGNGGCDAGDATALHGDLLNIFDQSRTHFEQEMSSLGGLYASSGALPVGVAIGVLGAWAAAYGVNRRLAEYR